jgi:cyclin-dependent kinase 2
LLMYACFTYQKMLFLDPTKRITARSALEHEYFKDIGFVP